RDHGAQAGCLMAGPGMDAERAVESARKFAGLAGADLAREVSCVRGYRWKDGLLDLDSNRFGASRPQYRVVAYDYGIKRNILRLLVERGCEVQVVPAQTPASDVLAMAPDGVLLGNGPGDPAACDYAIAATRELLRARVPLFG